MVYTAWAVHVLTQTAPRCKRQICRTQLRLAISQQPTPAQRSLGIGITLRSGKPVQPSRFSDALAKPPLTGGAINAQVKLIIGITFFG